MSLNCPNISSQLCVTVFIPSQPRGKRKLMQIFMNKKRNFSFARPSYTRKTNIKRNRKFVNRKLIKFFHFLVDVFDNIDATSVAEAWKKEEKFHENRKTNIIINENECYFLFSLLLWLALFPSYYHNAFVGMLSIMNPSSDGQFFTLTIVLFVSTFSHLVSQRMQNV